MDLSEDRALGRLARGVRGFRDARARPGQINFRFAMISFTELVGRYPDRPAVDLFDAAGQVFRSEFRHVPPLDSCIFGFSEDSTEIALRPLHPNLDCGGPPLGYTTRRWTRPADQAGVQQDA